MTVRQPQLVLVAALAVLALAIAGGGLVAVVLPQRDKASELNARLSAAETELVTTQTPAARPSTAAPNAVDIFRLMEAMPNEIEMPVIVLDLSALAKASHVTLVSVKPSTPVALAAGYSAVPITADIDGTYATVTAFLRNMRDAVQDPSSGLSVNGRLLITNAVALASTDGRTVDATLNLDAFEYGGSAPATVAAGTSAASTTSSTTTTSGSAG